MRAMAGETRAVVPVVFAGCSLAPWNKVARILEVDACRHRVRYYIFLFSRERME